MVQIMGIIVFISREMTTLLEILTKGTSYLEKKGVESARLNMELMVAHVLKMQRMQLYLEFERPLSEAELTPLREMLKRRGEREPLQHIIGEVEFCGRTFKSDARALIPRPETEELVEYVQNLDLPSAPQILDLCSGSGVIGLTLQAELPDAVVTLADISPEALALSRENEQLLGLEVQSVQSDMFSAISGKYDLIICNPPYVASGFAIEPEVERDPALALFSGADGLDFLRAMVPQVPHFLNAGGYVALEVGFDQGSAVAALLTAAGFDEVEVHSDMDGVPRFPIAR